MNYLRTTMGATSLQPVAAAAYAEPPLSPPVTPGVGRPAAPAPAPAPVVPAAPVQQPPAQSAVPVAPVPTPVAPAPAAPVAPAQQPPGPAAVDQTVAIFLHLSSGERIWAGRLDDVQSAEHRATEIVRALNRPEPGVWAKFGNRLIRPEAVVSIELAPRRED